MLAGVSGAAAKQTGADAPPDAELEGEMLAPEDFAAQTDATTPADAAPSGAQAAADAIASVAKDLAESSAAKDAARAGQATASAPTPPEAHAAPAASDTPGAPQVNTVEELDRVLAEIAQGHLGAVEAEAVVVAGLDAQADAARVKAALDAAAAVDPGTAVHAAKPGADEPAPTAKLAPDASEFTDNENAGTARAPDTEGDFEAPAPARSADASPQTATAAAETASPPAPPSTPHADAPAAPPKASPPTPAAPSAPAPAVATPPARAAETKAAPAPPPGKQSLLGRLLKPLAMLNEPFQGLSPVATQTVSMIAIITLFNAVCLWVFLMLR